MNEPTNRAQEHSDPVGAPGAQPASTDPATGYDTEPVPSGRSNSDRLYTQTSDLLAIAIHDLLDFPRQVLPEQTYVHLQNARQEAFLAIASLISNLNNAGRGSKAGKVRRHIDVE